MRILLVEDDELIGNAIRQALQDAAMAVDWVRDGKSAMVSIGLEAYELILLDLGLPKKDGISVLFEIRAQNNSVAVIIVTARDAVQDRINGLDLGADDYIVKPFSVGELEARIRAVIRRKNGSAQPLLSSSSLSLSMTNKELVYNEVHHTLSAREFAMMQALLSRPGAILSRNELEEDIYGCN